MLGEIDQKTGEAYFLVLGRPVVTIQFPWTEIVITSTIPRVRALDAQGT